MTKLLKKNLGSNFAYWWPFIRVKTHILDITEFYLIVRNVLWLSYCLTQLVLLFFSFLLSGSTFSLLVCYVLFLTIKRLEAESIVFNYFSAPKVVIYDFACSLHQYCLNRDPVFFQNTRFLVDRFHWKNHTGKILLNIIRSSVSCIRSSELVLGWVLHK